MGSRDPLVSAFPVVGLEAHTTTAGSLHGCWGSKRVVTPAQLSPQSWRFLSNEINNSMLKTNRESGKEEAVMRCEGDAAG